MSGCPSHKRLSSERDDDYYEACAAYYINQSNNLTNDRKAMQTLYDAVEGILDENTYSYVTNPFNTDNENFKRFPSRLRNYNIIKPLIKMFLGETSKKRFDAIVTVGNPDAVTKKNEAKVQALAQYLAQDFINNLNEQGINTGVPSKEIPSYQQAAEQFDEDYNDIRARVGQEALDYLKHNLDMDEKLQLLMYDWLVVGRVFTFKYPRFGDVIWEPVDPREITAIGVPTNGCVEDADAVIRFKRMTGNQILDFFLKEISEHKDKEDIVKYLDTKGTMNAPLSTIVTTTTADTSNVDAQNLNTFVNNNLNYFIVYHLTFKVYKKVGILKYQDASGQERETSVDDTYVMSKKNGDISIHWYWVNEIHEVFRLDNYCILKKGAIEVQRNILTNTSKCKHPYNGKIYGFRNQRIASIASDCLNFQVLFNIFFYRFEFILAKAKEKVLMFPIGLIPDGPDWDEDKFLYFINSTGIGFFDESQPKAMAALQGMKEIDLGLGQYMASMWDFMQGIKSEMWEQVGVNRQRLGDTYASDGKATTEQAIVRSSITSAEMNRQFDKFLEFEYRGLLDVSKIAWIDGKKGAYITSDDRRAFFELDAQYINYTETEFNVFPKNSQDEYEKLERARAQVLTMGQNGATPDVMMEVLDANSMASLKRIVKKGVQIEREYQANLEKQKNDAILAAADKNSADKAADNETKMYIADKQYQGNVEAALINADASIQKLLSSTEEMTEEDETLGLTEEHRKLLAENAKNNLNQTANRLKEQSLNQKERQNAMQLKIAKMNKN